MKKVPLTLFLLVITVILFAAPEKNTRIISLGPLKYQDIESSCKTILKDNGEILYFPNNNAILVESTETNIRRVELFIKYAREELNKKTAPSAPAAVPEVPNYKVIPLGNVDYGSIESNCRSWLSPDGKMVYSMVNNAVVVTDTPKVIEAIEKFIAELSKATPAAASDNIQYSGSGSNDSSTVIIYSDWGYPGYRYWRYPPRPYPPRPYPPPPPPRPPRPPRPVPPPPPVPVPIPAPQDKPAPRLPPGAIQQRPESAFPGRGGPPDGGKR